MPPRSEAALTNLCCSDCFLGCSKTLWQDWKKYYRIQNQMKFEESLSAQANKDMTPAVLSKWAWFQKSSLSHMKQRSNSQAALYTASSYTTTLRTGITEPQYKYLKLCQYQQNTDISLHFQAMPPVCVLLFWTPNVGDT